MNINVFFLSLMAGLSMIFFLFKPMKQVEKNSEEIPSLELSSFQLSELNTQGLTSIMNGQVGIKYSNRYIVHDLDYTDNTGTYISNIKSNNALYKNSLLDLDGNIVYNREDGLTFTTQKAQYNKQKGIMIAFTNYETQLNENRTIGSYLEYNNIKGITKSKNVTVNYKLKERK